MDFRNQCMHSSRIVDSMSFSIPAHHRFIVRSFVYSVSVSVSVSFSHFVGVTDIFRVNCWFVFVSIRSFRNLKQKVEITKQKFSIARLERGQQKEAKSILCSLFTRLIKGKTPTKSCVLNTARCKFRREWSMIDTLLTRVRNMVLVL